MADAKPSDLTTLTLEEYQRLETAGRVHQVSPPIALRVPFGPVRNITQAITPAIEAAARTREATSYMEGGILKIESGLVVPVTFLPG